MIDLVREVDLPYILDKFKKVEPVQMAGYSDIPPDMDDKSRAVYRLVVDAITNAKKFAGLEISNVSDILNNFITEVYAKFADINTSLSSSTGTTRDNFEELLGKSIDTLSDNILMSNEIEKTLAEKTKSLKPSIDALKDLILSLKESYEAYVSSIIVSFKDEFDDIEKKFASLIDTKLSKEFQNNTVLNKKIDNAFKNNLYLKKILEKFNVKYADSLKKMMPAQISIISDKMKRKIDAEKERIAKEKRKDLAIGKLLKKYGLIGGMVAIGINAKTLSKTYSKDIAKRTVVSLKKGAYYLVDNNLKTVNRDFGLIGAATSLVAKGLYALVAGKSRSAYLSVKNKPKKQKISKPDFSKFEIDKKRPIQELVFKIYDFAEIIRLNLFSFDQDITESYNARKKLDKDRAKELKKKSLSNVTKSFGIAGALLWLLRPIVGFLRRKIGGFLTRTRTAIGKRISKFWRGTFIGRRIEAFRVSKLAKKLMRRYPGLSKARALRLAKNARISQRMAVRTAAKAGGKGMLKTSGRALGKIGGPLALGINLIVGIMESNNKKYMSAVYGVAQDQINTKHQISFSIAAMVAGGGSIFDDPSLSNWLNLGLNMGMWYMLLGPIGLGVGAIFSLIGQERLARFIYQNPYTSLGITVGLVGLNPAVIAATGGWSIAVGLGAVGIGALVDRISKKESWRGATEIGKSVGMIAGALVGIGTGILIGMKVGAAVGTLIVPGLGTLVGGAVGAIVGIAAAIAIMFSGKWIGGLIGSLFETDEKKELEELAKLEGEKLLNTITLTAYKYDRHMSLDIKRHPGVGDDTMESYDFGNLWNGITSLEKLTTNLDIDVKFLLSKKQQLVDGNIEAIIMATRASTSTRNNPAEEASKRDASIDKYKSTGVDPFAGVPLRDR